VECNDGHARDEAIGHRGQVKERQTQLNSSHRDVRAASTGKGKTRAKHTFRANRRAQLSADCRVRYSVFFELRADLAWVARSISGGGCCSPAIAHQTLT